MAIPRLTSRILRWVRCISGCSSQEVRTRCSSRFRPRLASPLKPVTDSEGLLGMIMMIFVLNSLLGRPHALWAPRSDSVFASSEKRNSD